MTTPKTSGAGGTGLETRTLDGLEIADERSFRHVRLYADLKQVVRQAQLGFRILPAAGVASWDRALLLNLTYWHPDAGGDVLVDDIIPADVVAHVAWHHLSARALSSNGAPTSVGALFMGEAIASAFDLYLVGRLLGHAPDSSFLETQVPAMKDVAEGAGLDDAAFESLLQDVAAAPERAFTDLRALLFDASVALYESADVDAAFAVLSRLDTHRFAALLHRYELSNWVLYARAYGRRSDPSAATVDAQTRQVDQALRAGDDALDWLTKHWVLSAIG